MPSPLSAARRSTRAAAAVLRSALLAALVGIAVAGLGQPAAWSAAGSAVGSGALLPKPKAPVAQPKGAEGLQPYVPQVSCNPVAQNGVKKFRTLMLATYKRGYDGGATRACAGAGVSEHIDGRAWDWMLSAYDTGDKKVATGVIDWLLAPGPDGKPALEARRLGVMYIMYDHKIWGTWSATWKPIRAGADQHTSHIHFSFSWAGARARTSFWTGKVAAFDYGPCAAYAGQPAVIYTRPNLRPCPTKLPAAPKSTHVLAWTGTTSSDVVKAQALLGVAKADRTSTFGTKVRSEVVAYQKLKGLPVTGALDKATWVRLDPASRITSTTPAPTTTPPPTTPPPTKTPTTTPPPTKTPTTTPTGSGWTTVKYGMSGPKVLAVQKALKMAVANQTGYFGSITLAAVKAFQKAHGLTVDGVVGPKTAAALGLT